MRSMRLLALLLLASAAVFAQSPQHSIYSEDLDRKADPCTDFYQYANGAWRAQNPIPASMSRWSRRWAAGESNKSQVKGILEEAAARADWPKGSVEQQIGDYYGSCMNETQIDKLGITPIKPLLDEIDAMKTSADVQKMISRLHELRIYVPFGITSQPDNHDPDNVIASVFASGLGLPDRDYYLKTEPRFQDTRAKYLVHIEQMLRSQAINQRARNSQHSASWSSKPSSRKHRSITLLSGRRPIPTTRPHSPPSKK